MVDYFRTARLSYTGHYGKLLYISPCSAQEVHHTETGTNSLDKCHGQNTEKFVEEEAKKRTFYLEMIHKYTIKDKDDTITNLKDIISEHERRVFDLESRTSGNSSSEPSISAPTTHISSTSKLLDQIEKLQIEKEQLLHKLADYETQGFSSNGYSPHDSTDFDEAFQMGSCTTDTEKELMLIKRDKHYLDKEIKRLKEENHHLRQMLSKCGLVVSQVISSGEIQQRNGFNKITTEKNLVKSVPNFSTHGSVLSLDQQLLLLEKEIDSEINRTEKNEQKAGTSNFVDKPNAVHSSSKHHLELEIKQLKEELLKRILGSEVVNNEFAQLKVAYVTLKQEVRDMPKTIASLMSHVQKQIEQTLAEVNAQNKELVEKYLREMKLRKKLHNELVDLKGNIRVFCRVRPSIKEDGTEENNIVVAIDSSDDSLVTINNNGKMQFFDMDKAFGINSSQSQVFEEVSSLVRSVIDGFNVCIFAYGQTGSGKTYTMEGPQSDPGINQRALQLLFEETKNSEWQYEISASVMEIYNETLRDLLNVDTTNKLEIKMRPEGGLYVPGLESVTVSTLSEVNKLFEIGRKNRVTASTNMNEHSSRSHCILRVTVKGLNPTTGSKSVGYLNLVDLAGSERVSKSMADGTRLKEAQNINKSLSCLGDVIHALRNKHGHVPYRNSKLTYLLQDSLGGDSKTLMIVQVSPVEKNVSETACTLTFGQRVRNIELGAATRRIEHLKSPALTPGRPTNLSLSLPASPVTSSASSPQSSPHSPLTPTSSSPRLMTKKSGLSSSQKLLSPGNKSLSSPSVATLRTNTPSSMSSTRRTTRLAARPEMSNSTSSLTYGSNLARKSNLTTRLVKSASSPQNLTTRIDKKIS